MTKTNLRSRRKRVLTLLARGWDADRVARETGLSVHQVRLIQVAWGPR
jgi:DNA-binding NarL/FixJ family response regulator